MTLDEMEQSAATVSAAEPLSTATPVPRPCAALSCIDEHPQRIAVTEARVLQRPRRDEIAGVKKRIAEERSRKGVPEFVKNAKATELIVDAFGKRGDLFYDGVRSFVFLKDARVLLPIDFGELGLELALKEYGLYPKEYLTRQIIDGLRLEAASKRRTNVHAFSFFDRPTSTVYVYDFNGGAYRIAAGGVEHIDNGEDGILFMQNPQWTPWNVTSLNNSVNWCEWLLEGIRFAPTKLTEADQRLLFRVWVLTLFFPQLFPTRPILTLIGEKGSGKSSVLRRLGQLLFGPRFNVTALTSKPDDFDAAITTDPFVVADNADDAPKWFPDRLAVIGTGGTIKRRAYYTTNQLADFPIRAILAVTSRTPNFQREDVAERLLPLRLKRMEDFVAESELLAAVQENRSALLQSIMLDVALAATALRTKQAGQSRKSNFRMADFADFAFHIAPVVSTSATMDAVLRRLGDQQVAVTAEDDPLLELVDRWLADDDRHINIERELSLSQFGSELEEVAGSEPIPWDRGNQKSFGQYFRARKDTLRQIYGMSDRQGHAGSTVLSFHHRPKGDLGALGEHEKAHANVFVNVNERTGGEK
jgi:hypothetical protein